MAGLIPIHDVSDWDWDSATVSDDDLIYRRIPTAPNHRTPDQTKGGCRPSPAAFRLPDKGGPPTGLSGHLDRRIPAERKPPLLYDPARYGAVVYTAGVVRAFSDAGVIEVDDPAEQDPVLRGAHVEVRKSDPDMDRTWFREVRNAISQDCEWAQVPPTPCDACSEGSSNPEWRAACPRVGTPARDDAHLERR